jgi:hypothetical protein
MLKFSKVFGLRLEFGVVIGERKANYKLENQDFERRLHTDALVTVYFSVRPSVYSLKKTLDSLT